VPSTNVSCSLPQLPDGRYRHTLESSGLLCGGWYTEDSCLQWSPDTGSWEYLLTLDVSRSDHVSWTPGPDIGTYLMGGRVSERTTTLIKPDGTQEPGFPLQYDTKRACSISDGEAVIITGGYRTLTTVSVYTVEGWQQDLPPLNTGRYYHACSSYLSDDRTILMVTGGWPYTGTTEVYDSNLSSWAISGAKLPRPMDGLRATNIDGRVLIFGGYEGGNNYYDDILEFKPDEDTIVPLGHMTQVRAGHAISVVQTKDFSNWCQ